MNLFLSIFLFFYNVPELIIGKEVVEPGIVFIFEGAIKDEIYPKSLHLDENETNVHIEARVNWDIENIPKGAVPGGFIPYLNITAKIINQNNGLKSFIDLTPHINLIDNFHYARNIYLPGSDQDLYSIEFSIIPPQLTEIALHKDWKLVYGDKILKEYNFFFKNVDFKVISRSKRL
tara:strand:+ start:199 stop:726 length:528 start_codon:yes stop_codon:yes gene_type:complete